MLISTHIQEESYVNTFKRKLKNNILKLSLYSAELYFTAYKRT